MRAERLPALLDAYAAARSSLPVDDPDLLHAELALLTTFADLAELSRNRPTSDEEAGDAQVHSPREFFHAYLHSLDIDREGLPEAFRARLSRALLHYGVRSLEPSAELEDAVHRIFVAQERTADQLPAVLALLDRWLTAGAVPAGRARAEVAEVLDRLITATQLRYPSVGDVARAVRFRYFEQPVVLEARAQVFAEAERLLAELTDAPGSADPSALRRAHRGARREPRAADPPARQALRRHQHRAGADPRGADPALLPAAQPGAPAVVPARRPARASPASSTSAAPGSTSCRSWPRSPTCPPPSPRSRQLVADVADPANLVVDLYLSWPDRPADTDVLVEQLRAVLARSAAAARAAGASPRRSAPPRARSSRSPSGRRPTAAWPRSG